MTPGLWQIAVIVVVAVLVFGGRGRISNIMADIGKGINSFKKGLNDDKETDKVEDQSSDQANDKTKDKK